MPTIATTAMEMMIRRGVQFIRVWLMVKIATNYKSRRIIPDFITASQVPYFLKTER